MLEIQPSTYDSVKQGGWLNGASLSQPHGIGHAWAAFLWDMTWELIEKNGFNPNLYEDWSTGGNNLAYQIVNDGLKFQGCGPTFVTGRDAIIAAEEVLTGGENACTLWASFARRGLGSSASDGGTTSRNDGAEAFDTDPACRRRLPAAGLARIRDAEDGGRGRHLPEANRQRRLPLQLGDGGRLGGHVPRGRRDPLGRGAAPEPLPVRVAPLLRQATRGAPRSPGAPLLALSPGGAS